MGNYKSKNSEQKINLNHNNYNIQQNEIFKNESKYEKEVINEIIIELKISDKEIQKEINILCDKNQLIKDKKGNENLYKDYNINPPKEFNYFNKENTKLYLNDKEIEFNYKLKFNKIGINKIIIKSNINLYSLSSMFYNCKNIIKIKFIKIKPNNVINMSYMFYSCNNLSDLNLSSFNTNNVTDMSYMFYYCNYLFDLNLSSFNTNNVTNMSYMFSKCYNLSKLNLSSFNTNNVTNMSKMFYNCINLNKVIINKLNIKKFKNKINISKLKI